MIAILFIARFVHFAALSILLGAALFPFYGCVQRWPAWRWLTPMLSWCAWLALGSATLWFGAVVGSLRAAPDMAAMVWGCRLLLSLALVVILQAPMEKRRMQAVIAGALLLLIGVAFTGRGASAGATLAPVMYLASDSFHLLAAAIWIGALVVLLRLAGAKGRRPGPGQLLELHEALSRFSSVGPAVVAALILTGTFLIGLQNVSSVLSFGYGRLLMAKLAMFATMLGLAATNRRLTGRLLREPSSSLEHALVALRASLAAETILAALVLMVVAWLGAMHPS